MAGSDFLKKKKEKKRELRNVCTVFLQYGLLLADWCAFAKAVILQRELFEDRFW